MIVFINANKKLYVKSNLFQTGVIDLNHVYIIIGITFLPSNSRFFPYFLI